MNENPYMNKSNQFLSDEFSDYSKVDYVGDSRPKKPIAPDESTTLSRISEFLENVKPLPTIANPIKNAYYDPVPGEPKNIEIKGDTENLIRGSETALKAVGKGVKKGVKAATDTVTSTYRTVATSTYTTVANAANSVANAANSVSTTIAETTKKIKEFFPTNTYLRYLHLMFIVSVIVIIAVPIIKEIEEIRSENVSNKEITAIKMRKYLKSRTFEIISVIILFFIFLTLLFIVPEGSVPSFFDIIKYVYLFIFICSIFGFVFGSHFLMVVGFFILFLLAKYRRSHYFMPFAIVFILYIFRSFGLV